MPPREGSLPICSCRALPEAEHVGIDAPGYRDPNRRLAAGQSVLLPANGLFIDPARLIPGGRPAGPRFSKENRCTSARWPCSRQHRAGRRIWSRHAGVAPVALQIPWRGAAVRPGRVPRRARPRSFHLTHATPWTSALRMIKVDQREAGKTGLPSVALVH